MSAAKSKTFASMTAEERSARRLNVLSAAAFVFVTIIVGVPVWWNTTKVYRFPLPFAEIERLSEKRLQLNFSVEFVLGVNSDEEYYSLLSKMQQQFTDAGEDKLAELDLHNRMALNFAFTFRPVSSTERDLLVASESINMFDRRLNERERWPTEDTNESSGMAAFNRLKWFVFVPSKLVPKFPSEGADVFLGSYRVVYSRLPPASLRQAVQSVLHDHWARSNEVFAMLGRTVNKTQALGSRTSQRLGSSIHPDYSLDFYSIIPDPKSCPGRLNIAEFAAALESLLLSRLRTAVDFDIQSQALYGVDFATTPRRSANEKDGVASPRYFYFTNDQLPHLVNPLEAYLGATISNKYLLNFLLYTPPPKWFPLYFADAFGSVEGGKAGFVVASWGGITVLNDANLCRHNLTETNSETSDENSDSAEIDIRPALEVVVVQLRGLLGISQSTLPKSVRKSPAVLSDWELDGFHVRAIANYLFSSIATLQSLSDLLDKIPNIVISDEVGLTIERAVQAVDAAFDAAERNNVSALLVSSKRALLQAEAAFFDPSLLALLYFPDDQKYAIYIPLFLPVGLPVCLSLLLIVSYLRYLFNEYKKGKGKRD